MTTLFDSRLSDRDFSSHLLYVPDLLDWTKSKRLQLRTTPPIDGYEFVQVESLLCAIERKAGDLTTEQAFEIVANDPALNVERAAGDPTTARWLLGADAHRKWRELLSSAIAAHELALLDFGSKLPIDADTQAAPVEPWKEKARERACEIIKRDRAKSLYPSQENIADEIAKEFRRDGVMGADGKPLTGAYIKRHALNGISSAQGKQLSTAIRRGK